MSKPRRSRSIALVLIGATALPACMPLAPRAVHDRYASLEDCSADWGRPQVCDRDDDNRPLPGNYGGPRVVYRGPNYPEGDREQAQHEARVQALRLGALDVSAPGVGNHAIEAVATRGGFGASAHSFGRLG